jgi:shikimate dehydrogenase
MDKSFIENKIDISSLDKYAAIIGANPSNGARSPKLWNAMFKHSSLNYSMIPLDVTKDKIVELLDSLNQDRKFIGGAIAVPYKETVAQWLGKNITLEAKKIGAVNCLYRGASGDLYGTNTDGEASLIAFENKFGLIDSKKILIFGLGGAGKAVAAYFSSKSEKVIIATRSEMMYYAKKIGANWVNWSQIDTLVTKQDVIINCTSIGFGSQESLSPLSKEQVEKLAKSTIIYDIIYQPLETNLLSMSKYQGLSTLNGLSMNLEQAVLAYQYAVDTKSSTEQIRSTMSSIN